MEWVLQCTHLSLWWWQILSSYLNIFVFTNSGFDEIGGEGLAVVSKTCSFEIDVDTDSLDECHDKEEPYQSSEKLDVEVYSKTEIS